jgi:hypothetical protein
MRGRQDDAKVQRIVKETLSADFEKIKILKVCISPEFDSDGNEILRIDVIFEGAAKDVNVRKLSGAVRQIRPKLRAAGEKAFPLFSFISNKERDLSLECA